jgi:N-acetylmuramoyl-L-alanine amidase
VGALRTTRGRIHGCIPERATPFRGPKLLIVALLIIYIWPGESFSGVRQATPSFSQAYRSYRELAHRSEAKREDWLKVVECFAAIHRAEKGSQTGKRSLFLAGRSCLALYRSSGRVEDLDRAIKFLNEFVQKHRNGRDLIAGLQELKDAHLMKRGLKGPSPAISSTPDGNAQSGGRETLPTRGAATSPAPAAPGTHGPFSAPPTEPPDTCPSAGDSGSGIPVAPPQSVRVQDPLDKTRTESGIQGNPYRAAKDTAPPEPSRPQRTASLEPPSVSDIKPARRQTPTTLPPYVVVIDPGHGGRDPGAVSEDGQLKEKDVTLEIALLIRDRLRAEAPGIAVHLTRSDDRSMGLKERTTLANKLNADLFLSVHCNAAEDASSKGVETYYLSKANSTKAMAVAARENAIPLAKMNDLEATLLDLMLTSKQTESVRLATTVHCALIKGLSGITARRRDRGVRRGPFYVLFGAKMPAILVECGFINNRREKEKLSNREHLDSVAGGLATGTLQYLRGLGRKG